MFQLANLRTSGVLWHFAVVIREQPLTTANFYFKIRNLCLYKKMTFKIIV